MFTPSGRVRVIYVGFQVSSGDRRGQRVRSLFRRRRLTANLLLPQSNARHGATAFRTYQVSGWYLGEGASSTQGNPNRNWNILLQPEQSHLGRRCARVEARAMAPETSRQRNGSQDSGCLLKPVSRSCSNTFQGG